MPIALASGQYHSENSSLAGSEFVDTNLEGSKFHDVNLRRADFSDAALMHSDDDTDPKKTNAEPDRVLVTLLWSCVVEIPF